MVGKQLNKSLLRAPCYSRNMVFSCRGILFDLDGVLVDSTAAVARVWRRWASELGLEAEAVIHAAHGRRSIETVRVLAPQLDAVEENKRVESMEIADREGVIAQPGTMPLLVSLPAGRFSVVTSATRALAAARLEHAGIPVPESFISADDVVEGKPSPEPYLRGAQLLGLPPADCLVFEDTAAGIASAKAAGMRVVGLCTTYSANELGAADAITGTLADVRARVSGGLILVQMEKSRGREP
jgi:sugar-phosphatase